MLPLKTFLYLILLSFGLCGGVFYHPLWGVIGYIFSYNVNPIGHWWGALLVDWGIRYALLLAFATGLGIILHRTKLKYKKLFENQEILLILFIIIILLSIEIGFGFAEEESNAIKMTKVMIMILMATHIVTDLRKYEIMIWTLIIAGLYLGFEAYNAPDWMFSGGRLDAGLGGSDFSEGNFLGAHFGMLLPLIGVMFLKGGWKSKFICLISGVFVTNSIILCRSRGIFLAILIGILSAIIFSIRRKRKIILFGLFVAIFGAIFLTDLGFWDRMKETPFESSQLDRSTEDRIAAWKAALSVVSDNPLGIGEGNFKRHSWFYSRRTLAWRDTHNTFLRCLAELGIQGFLVLLLLILNAFNILRKLRIQIRGVPNESDFQWHIYGLTISLIIFIISGMFLTHTYVEELYWLLLFPVFLKRSVENQLSPRQPLTVNH